MVVTLWRVNSKVVIGSYRECPRDHLPDKVNDFTPDLCLVVIISLCHVAELVADELWNHSGLYQALQKLRVKLERPIR